MDLIVQNIVDGAVTGLIYASMALSLVMIYKSTHHINFAQGEMAMFSTYLAVSLISAGIPYWVAFFAVLVISFVAGATIERVLVRPLGPNSPLNAVVVFIGLFTITNSIAGWIWGYNIVAVPSPFSADHAFAGRLMSAHQLGMAVVILIEMLIIFVFFRFTSLGLQMRAAAENALSARLSGVSVDKMLAIGWGLAAAIGATAGILTAPLVFLEPNMMAGALIYGFAGALLGGLQSPAGAVAGGILVGIIESLAGTYLVSSDLKLTVAFVIIIAVLLIRPAGLFGRALQSRV